MRRGRRSIYHLRRGSEGGGVHILKQYYVEAVNDSHLLIERFIQQQSGCAGSECPPHRGRK
jgi:hypothetical protein